MDRPKARSAQKIIVLAVALMIALPLTALVEPADSPLRDKAFSHPDLHIGNVYVPASQVAARGTEDLATLGVSLEGAFMDARGGRWGTLMPKHPLLPGKGVGNELRWDSFGFDEPQSRSELRQLAWEAFVRYVAEREGALGIDVAELQQPGTVTVHRDNDLIQIHALRVIDGVPVRDSYLKGTISHGNLILLGARNWGDLEVSTEPVISADSAVVAAHNHIGLEAASAHWRKNHLAIVPMARGANVDNVVFSQGYDYRLVWVLHPDFQDGELGEWEALVDARSGELLAFQDRANYASAREVEGGVYPVSNDGVAPDGVEVTYPMPFADLANGGDNFVTDTGGNLLACVDGDITTTLAGPFLRMIDNCGAISETTAGDVLDLGSSGGIDCTVPPGASPGNTHASRSGFYEINRAIEWGRSHLPDNIWLQSQLPATMNINQNCNATGGPGGVNFYRSGGGCSNTGEIAGVFVHEWGHGMDGSDATPGISSPGEGIADIYASLRLNTSCIGRNFRATHCGGYGDPCTQCSGVRDIDFANRASGNPHTIAFIDNCNPGNSNGPCGGSVHCEGAVYGEAVWDLWNRDLTAAPYSMSLDTARELATRLTFVGSGAVGNWFSCNPGMGTGDGCNADGGYLNYLAADDDDGDLSNGTPHMGAINAAFGRHGIACPTPAVTDSGCPGTPTIAPVVTAVARDRGTDLSWGAVAGATSYRVYRGEGVHSCDFGKILVAETTETSFVDSGLKNGFEYYYIVSAMGPGDTCFGPASSCTASTPAVGANVALDLAGSGVVSFLTGDGDAFLDNCEEASVAVSISNLGVGSLSNVRVVDVRSADFPEITFTTPLPLAVTNSLDSCDLAQTDIAFQADGLALGDSVEIQVDFTSDELSPQVSTLAVTLGVPGVESDLQNFATRTFSFEADAEDWSVVTGTFDRTTTGVGSGGGGPATDFYTASSGFQGAQCDQIRSPVMSLSASSTMTMWTNFNIENDGGVGLWYDRANVGIRDTATGVHTLIEPSGGRDYNATGINGNCGTNGQRGWADAMPTWATSSFDATALNSAAIAGDFVQFEVRYGTDALGHPDGFFFDELTVTNVGLQVDDTQGNMCLPPSAIFADGFESGDTTVW